MMDWMEMHSSKVNLYNNIVECHDDDERPIEIKGVPQPISLNNISSLHLRKFIKKESKVYSIYMSNLAKDIGPKLEDHSLL